MLMVSDNFTPVAFSQSSCYKLYHMIVHALHWKNSSWQNSGGGFSMGSSYFYLEFLLAFLSLLKSSSKFRNPAILALEYTLVPDSSYPTQLHQAISGYKYLLSITHDPSRIVFSGDSAGATIILSLLLHIGNMKTTKLASTKHQHVESGIEGVVPGMTALISPWTTLFSHKHKNTASDYLDTDNLHQYARQYVADNVAIHDPLASPGNCTDVTWWKAASPSKGFFITYGAEEVFAPEISDLIKVLKKSSVDVEYQEAEGGIHAWPVASLFLCSTKEERLRGLRTIVEQISTRMRNRHEEWIGMVFRSNLNLQPQIAAQACPDVDFHLLVHDLFMVRFRPSTFASLGILTRNKLLISRGVLRQRYVSVRQRLHN